MKAPHGTSAFAPVVNEPGGLTLTLNVFSGGVWTQSDVTIHADVNGYYTYQDVLAGLPGREPADWGSAYTSLGSRYRQRLRSARGPERGRKSGATTFTATW